MNVACLVITTTCHSTATGYYTCKDVALYEIYSSAASPAIRPTSPVSGFAAPAAAPGELDEGAVSLVGEDEAAVSVGVSVSVCLPVSEGSVALPVGVALSLLSSSLELWVERGAGVAFVSLIKSLCVRSIHIAHQCQCPAPNRTRLFPVLLPSSRYSIFRSARQQLIQSQPCYRIPNRRRQMWTRR